MLAQNKDQLTPEEFTSLFFEALEGLSEEVEQTLLENKPSCSLEVRHIEEVLEILEAHLEEEEDREDYPQKYFQGTYMPRIDELTDISKLACLKKESLEAVIDFLKFTADVL